MQRSPQTKLYCPNSLEASVLDCRGSTGMYDKKVLNENAEEKEIIRNQTYKTYTVAYHEIVN